MRPIRIMNDQALILNPKPENRNVCFTRGERSHVELLCELVHVCV